MPYKLISLAFLFFFLIINKAFSENEFILPVKKPSIFKKIESQIIENTKKDLPQRKPIIQEQITKNIIVKKDVKQEETIVPKAVVT